MPGRRPLVPPEVAEVIRHLSPDVKRAIKAAIRAIGANPSVGERLHLELDGYWKFRARRYRVIYEVSRPGNTVKIFAVGERGSIYEEVAERLRSRK
jgi:mRNA-degrading endonuclease RelE of RelBE toxin-antitoxin system